MVTVAYLEDEEEWYGIYLWLKTWTFEMILTADTNEHITTYKRLCTNVLAKLRPKDPVPREDMSHPALRLRVMSPLLLRLRRHILLSSSLSKTTS